MVKWILRCAVSLGLIVAGFCFWVLNSTLQVEDVQAAEFYSGSDSPVLQKGHPLKILNWNLQFLAGNAKNHFFFDSGADTWPEEKVLLATLEATAQLIREEDPDVIFLQEVDDGATRTFFQDQVALLLDRLPESYTAQASTFYWRADFLPVPELWGSVGMKLSIISKYKIASATRHALAAIDSHSWIEQQFQPRRAVLEAELAVDDGSSVFLLNTHFSAFAQGTHTMERQVSRVLDIMSGFESRAESAIIGGDFNLIPSLQAREQLPEEDQQYYNPAGTELKPLLERFTSLPAREDYMGANAAVWYTHSPNHSLDKAPNKTLDYFFMTRKVYPENYRVMQGDAIPISDHMPLIASFGFAD